MSTALGGRASASVVIECFWSGESVWGLRVLEPMRRLLAELPPQRVRLICYNMDREVERAREVIQRCGGGLTQILGGPLLEVETLPELPVVRVLDGGGIVRDVWIGWQPSYDAARDLAFQLAGVRQ